MNGDPQHIDSTYLRPTAPAPRRRMQRVLIILALSVVVVVGLSLVADQWMRSSTGVRVAVSGTLYTKAADIERMAAIPDTANLADIDLMAVQKLIEQHPYVKRAIVRRDPPSTLLIEVVERQPVALIMNADGTEMMIDEEGFVFPVTEYPGAQDLPVMTRTQQQAEVKAGTQLTDARVLAAAHVLQTARDLDTSIYDLISEVQLDGRQDLVMYTSDCGVPVIFGPDENTVAKLWSLKAFWETVAVKEDPAQLEYIDLRFRNQVVVKWNNVIQTSTVTAIDSTDIIKD